VLDVRHARGTTRIDGRASLDVAAGILARSNSLGAYPDEVDAAVARIDAAGGPESVLHAIAQPDFVPPTPRNRAEAYWARVQGDLKPSGRLISMHPTDRLAAEMALHELMEREALNAELRHLEARWREAEEIAAIADELTLPESVRRKVREIRDGT
jgi:hypothetical protein